MNHTVYVTGSCGLFGNVKKYMKKKKYIVLRHFWSLVYTCCDCKKLFFLKKKKRENGFHVICGWGI